MHCNTTYSTGGRNTTNSVGKMRFLDEILALTAEVSVLFFFFKPHAGASLGLAVKPEICPVRQKFSANDLKQNALSLAFFSVPVSLSLSFSVSLRSPQNILS